MLGLRLQYWLTCGCGNRSCLLRNCNKIHDSGPLLDPPRPHPACKDAERVHFYNARARLVRLACLLGKYFFKQLHACSNPENGSLGDFAFGSTHSLHGGHYARAEGSGIFPAHAAFILSAFPAVHSAAVAIARSSDKHNVARTVLKLWMHSGA